MTTTRRAATIEQDNRHPRDLVLWMEAKVEALERKLAQKDRPPVARTTEGREAVKVTQEVVTE